MTRTFKDFYADFDDRMTEVGRQLGYKALKLKRMYRMRKAAKEDFEKRTAGMKKTDVRSIVFDVIVYIVIIAMLMFILIPYSGNRETTPFIFSANTFYTSDGFTYEENEADETKVVVEAIADTETAEADEADEADEANEANQVDEIDETYEVIETLEVDEADEISEDVETVEDDETDNAAEYYELGSYQLSEYDICLLVQAVQHETKIFEGYYNYDEIQQFMAASIVNRIGEPGFGPGYTTAYTVYDLLSNYEQYVNILWELDGFDPYDYTTRQNVYAVLNGTAYTPENLYYERCSEVGEDYWSAQNNFYANYPECYAMQIVYIDLSPEGRYIMFATNPYGAYASSY